MDTTLEPAGDDANPTATAAGHPWAFLLLWAIVLVALGAFVRIPGLGRSLWLDELTTAWVCGTDQGTLLERAWLNNLSPLYYTIVNASIGLFGYTEVGLRVPSLLAGLAVIPATLLFAWHHFRARSVAVVLSLIVAVDPVLVQYSFEARPYAMVMLLSLFQVHLFLSLFTRPTFVRAAGGGVVMALLVYLHYTAILIAGAEAVFVMLTWSRRHSPLNVRLKFHVCAFLVAAVLCLPLVPHILYLAESKDTLGFKDARTVWSVFSKFGFAWYVLVPLLAGAAMDQLLRTTSTIHKRNESFLSPIVVFAFALFWYAIPSGVIWLLAITNIARIDVDRYVAVASLAPIIGLGALTMLWDARITRAVCLGLGCVGCFAALFNATSRFSDPGRPYRDIADWRSAVTYVRQYISEAEPDDTPIIVWSGLRETIWLESEPPPLLKSYLLCPVNSLYRLDGPAFDGRTMPLAHGDSSRSELIAPRQFEMLARKGGAWIIIPEQEERQALLNAVFLQLDANGLGAASVTSKPFKGVTVIHITIE